MESPQVPKNPGLKRKRSPQHDEGRQPAPSSLQGGGGGPVTQINYLVKARKEKLGLIEGDADTFSDVLGMLDEYEGVLQRHESLAANLGAKLVGPLLLKSFEKLFDGPIKVIQPSLALEQSLGWLDVVTFAHANPAEFTLAEYSPGIMSCRIWIKGGQIEISEDDHILIVSGAPERVIPSQPIPEDELSELGTLNILEARLAMLIKKADAVASRARQLNYHLKGRKAAVVGRKAAEQAPTMMSEPSQQSRNFSPQPYRSPNIPNGDPLQNSKIQQQLLEQFLAGDRRQSAASLQPGQPQPQIQPRPKSIRTTTDFSGPATGQRIFNGGPQPPDNKRLSHPLPLSDDSIEVQYRVLMAGKMEKLARGDIIYPPCDRCRRLGFECTKNLTACSACTKKHAKCSWKEIREDELQHIPRMRTPGARMSVDGASSVDGNMDPSLGEMHGMGAHGMMGEGLMTPNTQRMLEHEAAGRHSGGSRDHATLTQIASAAAAAGHR